MDIFASTDVRTKAGRPSIPIKAIEMKIDESFVGLIIGKEGKTIKMIQDKTNTTLKITKWRNTYKLRISGPQNRLSEAENLVNSKLKEGRSRSKKSDTSQRRSQTVKPQPIRSQSGSQTIVAQSGSGPPAVGAQSGSESQPRRPQTYSQAVRNQSESRSQQRVPQPGPQAVRAPSVPGPKPARSEPRVPQPGSQVVSVQPEPGPQLGTSQPRVPQPGSQAVSVQPELGQCSSFFAGPPLYCVPPPTVYLLPPPLYFTSSYTVPPLVSQPRRSALFCRNCFKYEKY